MATALITNSFNAELLALTPHTAADTYKLALFTSTAALSATTTAYTTDNEVGASGTYSAGGATLTVTRSSSTSTAWWDFDDVSWTSATITARYGLIYNSSRSNKAVLVIDFTTNQTSTNGTFAITFPAAGASTAMLRYATA